MSYRTILFYKCDSCDTEYEYPCADKGPQFCQDGWLKIGIEQHIYRPYREPDGESWNPLKDNIKLEAIFCPKCVQEKGIKQLSIMLLDFNPKGQEQNIYPK